MSKYIVDIHGDIEGDYEIVGKYKEQEPVLDKIRAEIEALTNGAETERIWNVDVLAIIDKYKGSNKESE